jgi:hypothetical protein
VVNVFCNGIVGVKNDLIQRFNNSTLHHTKELPHEWFSELDIFRSELLIWYKHDIAVNETFNYIIYNLKPKIYEMTLAIVKREKNDPNYLPTIDWDHASTPMKNYQSLLSNEIVAIELESPAIVKASEWMKQILEAKYEKANIITVFDRCLQFLTSFSHCLMAHLDIGKMNVMI